VTTRVVCFAGFALASLLTSGSPASSQQPDKIRVDLAGEPVAALALLMANDAGFYVREGLQVFIVGKSQAQDIAGTTLRLRHAGLVDVMLGNRDGEDARLVAATSRRLTGVVASVVAIEEKRDLLLRFLRATIEGNYLALIDGSRARGVLARDARVKGARAIDSAYRDFQTHAAPDMDISVTEVGNLLKATKIGFGAEAYVDDSLLAELRKAGFFETLRPKHGRL
jgi:hypothetical protein